MGSKIFFNSVFFIRRVCLVVIAHFSLLLALCVAFNIGLDFPLCRGRRPRNCWRRLSSGRPKRIRTSLIWSTATRSGRWCTTAIAAPIPTTPTRTSAIYFFWPPQKIPAVAFLLVWRYANRSADARITHLQLLPSLLYFDGIIIPTVILHAAPVLNCLGVLARLQGRLPHWQWCQRPVD